MIGERWSIYYRIAFCSTVRKNSNSAALKCENTLGPVLVAPNDQPTEPFRDVTFNCYCFRAGFTSAQMWISFRIACRCFVPLSISLTLAKEICLEKYPGLMRMQVCIFASTTGSLRWPDVPFEEVNLQPYLEIQGKLHTSIMFPGITSSAGFHP